MLDLQELLFARGLPKAASTKLIRHQDSRWDLQRLLSSNTHFDYYQSHQSKPVFDCSYVVSFVGQSHSQARFVGVYAVKGVGSSASSVPPRGFPYPAMPVGRYRYKLEHRPGFEDLEHRVVIEWGSSARAWHQWLKPKEVVEVLPKNYVMEFPGYEDFILGFDDLKKIIHNHSAHREWHRMLGAVAGIYLITDGSTGKQYVGSAYGNQGVLGRWSAYARTGHGGNKVLRQLIGKNSDHAKHFSFTILRTLPRTLSPEEVFEVESLYKKKLGSRAFGLNAN